MTPAPVQAVTPAPVQVVTPAPVQVVTPAPAADGVGVDLERLVLEVVADKTGYPVEMLAGHMELGADLGIDSIKRVEILSAVRRGAPELPEVDPGELGKLRSLGEIIDRLRATTGTASAPAVPAAPQPAIMTPAPVQAVTPAPVQVVTLAPVQAVTLAPV